MQQTVNRAAPSFGNAIAYFVILYFVIEGTLPEQYQTEAALMAGVIFSNIIMDLRGMAKWVMQRFEKKEE